MQPTIPNPVRGGPSGFHSPAVTRPTGQPAPAFGVQGGHGPAPAMVTPQPGSQSQAWGDVRSSNANSSANSSANPIPSATPATPGVGVFLDDAGEEVNTQYNALLAELWKGGIVPELRLVALMNFRTFNHLTINNAMRLLRVDIAIALMGRAPDDYAAAASSLRPMVACDIPSFYDGFLLYGATVANATLANVDFGGGALQAELAFLPALGALPAQPSRSPQQSVQQSVQQPPPQAQQFSSPPSHSPLPARRDIVPQHTVPRLVLNGTGPAQQRKQPAQSQ